MNRNISSFCDCQPLSGAVVAGTDGARVTNLAEVDAKDCQSVVAYFNINTVVATGILTAWAKNYANTGAPGAGTIGDVGSVSTVASAGAGKPLVLEVVRPTLRFLRFDYQRTVANIALYSVVVIKNKVKTLLAADQAARKIINQGTPSAT